MPTATIVLDDGRGFGGWDAKLTVVVRSGCDLTPEQLEAALVYRLRMADDIVASSAADVTAYRLRCERAIEREKKPQPVVTYAECGFRSDVADGVRARIRAAADGAPREFIGPRTGARYSISEAGSMAEWLPADVERAQVQALGWATSWLMHSDVAELWSHRAIPESPGVLITALDDDGWAATADPVTIWLVTGVDCLPHSLNNYTPHRLDEVLGCVIDYWEADLVLRAGNCLLRRESSLAFYLDYDPSDLNPGWDPAAGVGAFTGWVLGCRSRPTVRPFGNNSTEFRDDLPRIRRVFETLGSNRLQWAIAHDEIVYGLRECDLGEELRRFIGLLIDDLILVRAGYVGLPGPRSDGAPIRAVPAAAPRAETEFVLTGVALLYARETVYGFAGTATLPVGARVFRAARGRDSDRYPPGAIRVEVDTLTDLESFETVKALARLLKTEGHWTEWKLGESRTVPAD